MRFTAPLGIILGLLGLAHGGFGQKVVVYSSVDQIFSERVFHVYERKTGIQVTGVFDTEETKSTGIVNRLIAEQRRPRADVFFSGDPLRAMVLKKKGVLTPYASPMSQGLPTLYRDEDHAFTGFSARARIILVNTDLVTEPDAISGLADFLDPKWSQKTAIANPLFGTTSYHLAALFVAWGDEKAKRFLDGIRANGCRVVSSNGEVRRLVSKGEVAFGLTDTDDARVAELEGSPVRTILPDQTTAGEWGGLGALLIPSCACLIAGGPNPEEGRRFIDFLLSPEVEELLARLECAQMPLRHGVPIPEGMIGSDQMKTLNVDLDETADRLEAILPWLEQWSTP